MSPKTLIKMLGFDVPKWICNSCPLKHEAEKMPMSNEMCDEEVSKWKVTYINYNIYIMIFDFT